MGDLTHNHAQTRVRTALNQHLEAAETPPDQHAVYEDVIDRLLRIAIDEEELDRLATNLAIDPDAIDWPENGPVESNRD
jgi:hypothetical protein